MRPGWKQILQKLEEEEGIEDVWRQKEQVERYRRDKERYVDEDTLRQVEFGSGTSLKCAFLAFFRASEPE